MKKFSKRYYRIFFNGLLKLILPICIIFISAGKINYWQGWVYGAINLLIFITLLLMATIKCEMAELLSERVKFSSRIDWWDKAFWTLYLPLSIALVIIAGLDVGRFEWSMKLQPTICTIAYIIYVISNFIILRAMWSNIYFSSEILIQNKKAHEVVHGGPYRFVRHPGYAGGILLFISQPVFLGSLIALIPASFLIILLIIRVFKEDSILQKKLIGYPEYVKKVKYRLVPGIL
jgi:protein-S-isoprenylcysteine O-methyltransferase Ste14